MKRLDLKIGFACNNRCHFCAQGEKRGVLDRRPLDQIVRALAAAAADGVKGVVFTGGEPTLHPDLPAAVSAAKSAGFESIQIQSNGRRFAYPAYCRQLLAAGVTEFSPSLHGSRAKIHDDQTRAPGAWRQVVSGIRNLKSLGAKVLTNSVVTKGNYTDLPALARLLVHLGVDQFQFAFIHIVGSAAEAAQDIVPRKSEAVPYMLEGMRIGKAARIRCYTEAVPYCLLEGMTDCSSENMIPDGPVVDLDFKLTSWKKYRTSKGKAKRALCRACLYDSTCEGPWREYPRLYGWREFVPRRAANGAKRRARAAAAKS